MDGWGNDPLDAMLRSFPELRAPENFVSGVEAKIRKTAPLERKNPFQVSGILCIASAAVMLVVMNTPVITLIPQIMQLLGGWIQ